MAISLTSKQMPQPWVIELFLTEQEVVDFPPGCLKIQPINSATFLQHCNLHSGKGGGNKRLFNQAKKFTPVLSFCLVSGFCECEIFSIISPKRITWAATKTHFWAPSCSLAFEPTGCLGQSQDDHLLLTLVLFLPDSSAEFWTRTTLHTVLEDGSLPL